MTEHNIIDPRRETHLCDVGNPDYLAAVVVTPDGTEHLLLAQRDAVGDDTTGYDPTCRAAPHEQLGPLPLKYIRRLMASRGIHRCGRPTKGGAPCRTPVTRAGEHCTWHRTPTHTEGNR